MKTVPVNARSWAIPGHRRPKFSLEDFPVGETRHYFGPFVLERFKRAWYRWAGKAQAKGRRHSIYRTSVGVLVKREPDWREMPRPWMVSCFRDLRVFRNFMLDRLEVNETIAILDTRFRMWSELTEGERQRWSENLAERARRAINNHDQPWRQFIARTAPEQLTPTVMIRRIANTTDSTETTTRNPNHAHDPLD